MPQRCPICHREVPAGARTAPFCDDRCRLLDLGNWLDERYVVQGAPEEDSTGASRDREGDGGDEDAPRS